VLRPWVLALAAVISAVVAVAIPRGPWADEIYVVEQVEMVDSIKVQIDDRRVVVHPPDGYTIGGWGQGSEPSVQITMTGERGIVHVTIEAGAVSRDAVRRGAVAREIVDGATMTVFSRLAPDVVQRMFDALEIS
jgi:hypothetical protein